MQFGLAEIRTYLARHPFKIEIPAESSQHLCIGIYNSFIGEYAIIQFELGSLDYVETMQLVQLFYKFAQAISVEELYKAVQ